MRHLHEKQQQILSFLLENPDGATADQLSIQIGVTKTAARQHIDQLERMGYLSFKDIAGTVGRPKRSYFLSDSGVEAFPRQYAWLSNLLLTQLTKTFPADQVSSILRDIARSVASEIGPGLVNRSDRERLVEIVKIMNDLGYRAQLRDSEENGISVIEATNCVYHDAAKNHPQLCEFDIHFLTAASQKDVTMECCIARGGATCRFRINI